MTDGTEGTEMTEMTEGRKGWDVRCRDKACLVSFEFQGNLHQFNIPTKAIIVNCPFYLVSFVHSFGSFVVKPGPFGTNDRTCRRIFILNVTTFEEANQLLQTDPTVHSHIFETELYNWYGSAALPAYLEAEDKVWKERY